MKVVKDKTGFTVSGLSIAQVLSLMKPGQEIEADGAAVTAESAPRRRRRSSGKRRHEDPRYVNTCRQCKMRFRSSRAVAQYCSTACRGLWWKEFRQKHGGNATMTDEQKQKYVTKGVVIGSNRPDASPDQKPDQKGH